MPNKKMLEEAARKFINKVDNGRARNKETYAELKVAMGTDESVPVEAEVGIANSGRDEVREVINIYLNANRKYLDEAGFCSNCDKNICPHSYKVDMLINIKNDIHIE